jgi:hypothetical protein
MGWIKPAGEAPTFCPPPREIRCGAFGIHDPGGDSARNTSAPPARHPSISCATETDDRNRRRALSGGRDGGAFPQCGRATKESKPINGAGGRRLTGGIPPAPPFDPLSVSRILHSSALATLPLHQRSGAPASPAGRWISPADGRFQLRQTFLNRPAPDRFADIGRWRLAPAGSAATLHAHRPAAAPAGAVHWSGRCPLPAPVPTPGHSHEGKPSSRSFLSRCPTLTLSIRPPSRPR